MIVGHMVLRPGDVIVQGDMLVTIVRHGEAHVETVFPLTGRDCWRYWARREDTGDEGYVTFGPGATVERRSEAPTALVRCGSHRAREKLKRLFDDERDMEALYSLRRNVGTGGAYRIPAEYAAAAKAIVGVTGMRDGDDLMRCWPSRQPFASLTSPFAMTTEVIA
jgi:hypothetical protein